MRDLLIESRGNRKQSDVAKKLGISQQYLSSVERGINTPSPQLMRKFARFYNKEIITLFADILKTN